MTTIRRLLGFRPPFPAIHRPIHSMAHYRERPVIRHVALSLNGLTKTAFMNGLSRRAVGTSRSFCSCHFAARKARNTPIRLQIQATSLLASHCGTGILRHLEQAPSKLALMVGGLNSPMPAWMAGITRWRLSA